MSGMFTNLPGSTSETRVTDFITVIVGLVCILVGMAVWILTNRDVPAGVVTLVGLAMGASKAGKVVQSFSENRDPSMPDTTGIKGPGHE